MPSIQNIVLSLGLAACVAAQASQITDGQVQAVTATPVAQITDGQIQAVTSAPHVTPVAQITDGQIQAVTSAPHVTPVAQITDGQIQAVTSAPHVTPVVQITDGQVQAAGTRASTGMRSHSANGTFAAPSPSAFVGAANIMGYSKEIVVAAVGAAAGFAML